jgi:hypothetical protein
MTAGTTTSVGRARTVLVFGEGDAARAVVSTVLARVRRNLDDSRLLFTGTAVFDAKVIAHLTETVLPTVDGIVDQVTTTRGRTRKPKSFEVSLVNLGAASAVDVGLSVSGFSADVPVLLSMLSAALSIPLPQDVVTTGHVASSDGDIRPVRNIPAKLAAAVEDSSIMEFVHPSVDADASMHRLSPTERDRIKVAVINGKDSVRVGAVTDVGQLLRRSVTEESLVLGSLRSGFFESNRPSSSPSTPIEQAASYITQGNDERFWRALETHLLGGNGDLAGELFLERIRYQVRRKRYPDNLGRTLYQLIQSLPPATRRVKIVFPLAPKEQCLRLCRFAGEQDYEDVQCLMNAVLGKVGGKIAEPATVGKTSAPTTDDASAAVEAVLTEIDANALTRKIGLPIDSARASYVMGEVLVDSKDEFNDVVSGFYLALLRHRGMAPASTDHRAWEKEAQLLLERAFAKGGGIQGARAEARDGIHGGMRFVLDAMTEQYKLEQQSNHMGAVIEAALGPMHFDERVAFMRALLDRLSPHLPAEVRGQPPERFARHYDIIVRTYVQSLDRVKQLLRTF